MWLSVINRNRDKQLPSKRDYSIQTVCTKSKGGEGMHYHAKRDIKQRYCLMKTEVGRREILLTQPVRMASKCTKDAWSVYAPVVMVSCPCLGPEKDTCRQDSLSKWIDWYQSRPISVFIRQYNTKFSIQKPMQAETYQYTLDNVQAGLIYVSCSHLQVNIVEWLRRSANMLDKYRSREALLQNHSYTNVRLILLFKICRYKLFHVKASARRL